MDELHRSLIAHIRALATERGVQLTHLADLAGVGRSHFWNVLKGSASPTVRWLDSIAKALDVPTTRLLEPRPTPQLFEGVRSKRYEIEVPLYTLQAAASTFSGSQDVAPEANVRVRSGQRDPARLFVGRVRGKSMEPTIPANSFCLFRAAPIPAAEGKVVLVQLRGQEDPETGGRYTVKRLRKKRDQVELHADNPRFAALHIPASERESMQLVAELIDVLTPS